MGVIRRQLGSAVVAMAMVLPPLAAFADDLGGADPGSVLRIPGLPPVPLPPGTHVYGPGQVGGPEILPHPDADIYHEFGTVTPGGGAHRRGETPNYGGIVIGPGGVVRPQPERRVQAPKPKPPTLEEKQALIRKALAPKPPLAAVRRKTLDDLYIKLAAAKDEDEAKGIASVISAIWMRSGSDTANLLVARAEKAVLLKDYPLALSVLDKVVELQPTWAEAWNKRASIRYLAGDLDGAMADVDRVLKLEPNHFSALNGLAMILQSTGFAKRALQVYRHELAIYPHQPEVEKMVDKLSLEVEGQGI